MCARPAADSIEGENLSCMVVAGVVDVGRGSLMMVLIKGAL